MEDELVYDETEIEVEETGDIEDITEKPTTHMEEENYEVGDTNIQEE